MLERSRNFCLSAYKPQNEITLTLHQVSAILGQSHQLWPALDPIPGRKLSLFVLQISLWLYLQTTPIVSVITAQLCQRLAISQTLIIKDYTAAVTFPHSLRLLLMMLHT